MKKNEFKKPISFTKIIPNFITLLGLTIGVSAIRFAIEHRWEMALYCVLIAAVLDGIDGRVARLLNATSPFGAELDSLCDFANFGIVPGVIMYLWSFQQYELQIFAWGIILLFIVCMAIRLARFNTAILTGFTDSKKDNFAIGVPAPSGALLALMPIMLDFEIGAVLNISFAQYKILILIYLFIISLLLASRIPTFLFKNVHIKPEYLSTILIAVAVVIINIIIYPWYTLPLLCCLYLLSIPLAVAITKKMC